MSAPLPLRQRKSSSRAILDAARRLVQRGGAAALSMGDVATEAGVSKALVLYHFHDKDSLLEALVDDVGGAVLERARTPLSPAGAPLDALWGWLENEIDAGDVRVLVLLAASEAERAVAASVRIAEERLQAMASHVDDVFRRLQLRPRMPAALLAETMLAFADGLACRAALGAVRDSRGAFDVLWLALLTLNE